MSGFMHKDIEGSFPWGPVVDVHHIAGHKIIEYRPGIYKKSCHTGEYDMSTSDFHVEGTSSSYDTLEQAIVGAIAEKYEGANGRAAGYFWKMISRDAEAK